MEKEKYEILPYGVAGSARDTLTVKAQVHILLGGIKIT